MPYKIDENVQLGSGGYGKVYTATDAATGERVAAKVISLRRMKRPALEKEVMLMERLSHPGIIGLRGHEEVDDHYVIYMELAGGGELFSRVIKDGSLKEHEARSYFEQLLQAVQYMHSQGVAHRDLKLENVLLAADDTCKVCDFGLAHVYERDASGALVSTPLREVVGSKSYCAPEVLEGRGYEGFGADAWSLGISLFAMLAGFFPLDEASGADWRFERVKLAAHGGCSTTRTVFGFYERPCMLSREVCDLIDGLLQLQPPRRLALVDALGSPWVTGAKLDPMDAEVAEVPRYRSLNATPEALAAMLNDGGEAAGQQYSAAGQQYSVPVYRGGPPLGPPPTLQKQEAFFCADFHVAPPE